jgi:hypothetical protein
LREKPDRTAASGPRVSAGTIASYGLIVGAVVLGWQMAIQPLKQRAPPEVAIRLAPGSPLVLRRAAEAELAAGRVDNAAALSQDALARSPFDVRALRVFGLTEAHAGREKEADDILTLAGNWSLRDDPAHAWLVERRLRRGDYFSAFAHADTLARRRQDLQPQLFRLFNVAGREDPQRALPEIARLMARRPPWRPAYWIGISQSAEDLPLAANLAALLETSSAPLTNDELQHLYRNLLAIGHLQAVTTVRARINRPPPSDTVTNGGFADTAAPEPFQWRLHPKAGIVVEIVADDLRPSNPALRVDYDGYATGFIAEQLTSLSPGSYRFSAEVRAENGAPAARLAWSLSCATGGGVFLSLPAGVPGAAPDAWTRLSGRFDVPASCPAQWLRLETVAGDRRSPTAVWFDQITISPAG